jgi:hypothetical protein
VKATRRVIFVRETQASKGAISLPNEVEKIRIAGANAAKETAQLRAYLAEPIASAIDWHRDRAFLEVSLLELCKALVSETTRMSSVAQIADPLILMGGLLSNKPPRYRLPTAPPGGNHMYVSAHNVGAREVVEEYLLCTEAALRHGPTKLSVSDLPADLATARARGIGATVSAVRPSVCVAVRPVARSSVFVLYLDARTWSQGGDDVARHSALRAAVLVAMELRMHVLLLHERGGAHQTTFEKVLRDTPTSLVECGMYSNLATPLLDGVHRTASVRLAIEALLKLLGKAPAQWDLHSMRRSGDEDEAGEARVTRTGGAATSGKAGASAWYEPFLEAEHFVHGIDDTPDMVVNPVQLTRMAHQTRQAPTLNRPAAEARAKERQKPSSWARLGISVGSSSTEGEQLDQLKKLHSHLAAVEGVVLPTNVTVMHHI